MTGHKKEVRPGVWKLRVSAGKDPVTGKYVYVSKTIHGGPRIADQELAKLVVSAETSAAPELTLNSVIEAFLALRERQGISAKTLDSYQTLWRNHISGRLGVQKIAKLRPGDLDHEYGVMAAQGVGVSTIEHVHRLISAALGQAVKWEWLTKNPASSASPPTAGRTVVTAPTVEELNAIIQAVGSAQMANMFALLALTGARRGEIVALRWSDFDFAGGILAISKSVGYTAASGIFVKSTKTNKIRRISADETTTAVIVSQMDDLKSHVEQGFDLAPDPYLFPGDPGGFNPIHPDTPSKAFRRVVSKLGLAYHLHQLRHFAATQLIAGGFDPITVAARLGHDASVLMTRYAHLLEARDRAASEYLGARVFMPKPIDHT